MQGILTAVLVVFIVALAAWAVAAWKLEARRRRGLAVAGDPAGLRIDQGDLFDLPETYFDLHLFTRGHSRLASNMLHGQLDGLAVRVFDYQFETGSGRNRRSQRWQVALVHTDLHWPGLLCQPMADYDPLEAVFGLDPVPFQVAPFATQFHVACEDREFAYRFLHAQTADLLVSQSAVNVEARGQVLAVYRSGLQLPADVILLAQLARRLVSLAPESLREEMR
ncbi:MAG: hypothetical protein PHU85_13615 [Phycisphaerae bacterium]|nr:hypothetical protein [Phycisphaerae bacterium]